MGLCKCPKRKVTNLFCFEHRVNVCEHCLTENHPRCVVQSYLNWLKDSDYVPNCALCGISLMEGDVVRLICYDVFHTTCMEKHYKKLPSNTAPAGYKCFSCEAPVFPMPNQAGKVIDRLKGVLSNYNWARVGLGLPLIDEPAQPQIETSERTEREEIEETAPHVGGDNNQNNYGSIVRSTATTTHNTTLPTSSPFSPSSTSTLNTSAGVYSPGNRWNDTAVHKTSSNTEFVKQCVEQITADEKSWNDRKAENSQTPNSSMISMNDTSQQQQQQITTDLDSKAISRKLFAGQNDLGYGSYTIGEDPDGVDKYKRRSAFSWLSRWIKSRMLRGRGRETRALPRRGLVIMFIFLLFFFTILMIMIGAGRSGEDDPNFDPHHNPMVHVDQPEFIDMGGRGVDDPLLAVQPAAGGG